MSTHVSLTAVFLTFHSKPVTAMPPAAPVPARPMNRPEPSELAKRDDPICARQKKRSGGFTAEILCCKHLTYMQSLWT